MKSIAHATQAVATCDNRLLGQPIATAAGAGEQHFNYEKQARGPRGWVEGQGRILNERPCENRNPSVVGVLGVLGDAEKVENGSKEVSTWSESRTSRINATREDRSEAKAKGGSVQWRREMRRCGQCA